MTERRTHAVDIGKGLKLHVEEVGEGPPILFGSSILCDGRMWEAQVAAFSKKHRCVTFDWPGHGRSGKPSEHYTIEELSECWGAVMDALGIERAVLIGLSLGGMTALHYALKHPDRVEGMVIMNSSAEAELNTLKYRILARLAKHIGVNEALVGQVVPLMFGTTFEVAGTRTIEEYKKRWMELDGDAVHKAVRMLVNRPDITGRLSGLEVPIMTITGYEDRAIPTDHSKKIKDAVQYGREKMLANTGHLSAVEKPEEVNECIGEYLEELREGVRDLRTGVRLRSRDAGKWK